MRLDPRFIKVAHDPGDPQLVSHCPFCGSGQVTGRSDGGIDCAFCGMSFLVRVQPAFPGMPQAPGMGAPTDIGPDMPMGMPPGAGPDQMGMMDGGFPPGADEGGFPPGADEGGFPPGADEGAVPGEEGEDEGNPFAGGGDGDEDDEGPPGKAPPAAKDKDKAKGDKGPPKSKKKSALRRYRTIAGDELDETRYIRHLAVMFSGGSPQVLAALRHEAADSVIPAREYEPGYDAEHELQDWMNELRSKRQQADQLGEKNSPAEHEATLGRFVS